MTSSVTRRLVPLAAAALVLLSACGGSDDDADAKKSAKASATPSATAAPIDRDQIACKSLTAADRAKLAGSAVDEIVAATGADGSSQCRWQSDKALVQVTTLPAKQWAKSLPAIVKQLESSGELKAGQDKKDLDAAKKLLAGADKFTDKQACDAFVTLAELGGEKKGTTTTVTTVPISQTESGISAQTCSDGTLTSIIYSVPGLKETKKIDRTVQQVLASAHQRVTRKG
ncbi:hypothetical protein [Aeromicrobium wangtongii]|uniref:DUF3558 domain-containing protein n=1 Tax=Aeromicrobium wangtongii TaxID=2969247 RepID=A0ABY5MCZ8_9ACTN|nr:hypothetical protein [Aeromicrobium wangtongii]MCD9199330.1 hypothetical protein [Aeromicrobium wangtongii]UUP13691.1 hypothetical protein NQV15_17850 [Aeromicrobium wangtongii]